VNPTALSPQLKSAWERHGWCVIQGAIPVEDLVAAQSAVEQLFPPAAEMDSGRDTERTIPWRTWDAEWPQFPFRSTRLNKIVVHDVVIELARELLGTADVRLYQALASAKYTNQPSGFNQLLHTDYPNHTLVVPRRDFGYQHLETFIYLSDVSAHGGATRMVSRTKTADIPVEQHTLNLNDYRHLYEEPGDASGPAGSIAAYSPDVYHRSVDLTAPGASRFMLHVAYVPAGLDWVGYHAWPTKGFSPEWHKFVSQATPRQLAVLGFPEPGHPYWTDETLAGVAARYPGLDMGPWLAVVDSPRRRRATTGREVATADRITIGTLDELQETGCLTAKAGARPICVFWSEGAAFALDDRCPHMGFPLHRGTVESGMVTCHWHNARFDLSSGGTLDPWADDVRAYPVEIDDGRVTVVVEPDPDRTGYLMYRLGEGLEQGITLVVAKAVLGLLDAGVPAHDIVRAGVDFGTRYRHAGWGAGLTVLTAMANALPYLDPADQGLALVQGLTFVSRDTRGRPPRFPLLPLAGALPAERLGTWYRRFVETRAGDAAERTLATAITVLDDAAVANVVFSAVTDHVFIDGGHTIDFTNKAFEVLDHLGWQAASEVLTSLVAQTASASRSEEQGSWRYPHDLAGMIRAATAGLPERVAAGARNDSFDHRGGVAKLAWSILSEDPAEVVAAIDDAVTSGAGPEELGRALAYAAALRITRFHTQNDHGDWDEVHHAFTAANALHQAVLRAPTPELLRAVYHGALRIYLDRFLNVPAARLPDLSPTGEGADLAALQDCWDQEGRVDEAGITTYRYLSAGGDPTRAIAVLGHALLTEDAEFHWFQTYEAAVRQFHAWPAGSEEGSLILAGTARFLAAHTPTRRELSQVVRIATRLRRGEALFE
jgi:nitrite reductase/ring-hydroxylating ferredoxin subunit